MTAYALGTRGVEDGGFTAGRHFALVEGGHQSRRTLCWYSFHASGSRPRARCSWFLWTMAENPTKSKRRAGRPPAGARAGERVKDYPQLSIRMPLEMKARLNALSAVTGLSQWRVIVEAIECFCSDLPPNDRELVDGLSERFLRSA